MPLPFKMRSHVTHGNEVEYIVTSNSFDLILF